MRKILLWMTAAAGLAAVARAADKPPADDPYSNVEVLARAMQLIRQDYVDAKKISYHDLTYSALRGMLSELDPHSEFMDQGGFKDMEDETKSEFGGLGIVVTLQDGMLTIVNPMEDSPSFAAGIMPGDRILRINGQATDKLTLSEAIDLLRGEAGEKITLTLQRPSTKEIKDYDLTRTTIKWKSVKDAQILPSDSPGEPKIGYVRVTKFTEPTAADLAKALDGLERQGMQALIMDLRNNPGGLLNSAVDVCGLFVPPSTRIVYTLGRPPERDYNTSDMNTKTRTYPLVILTNYASASGSEIVAGALHDLHRALLVGETTFGKGSVQSVVSLPDGSALRFTTAKYFTPSGRIINQVGVVPDVHVALTPEQEYAMWRQRRDDAEESKFPPIEQDPQLSRAVDLLRGAAVFSERREKEAGKGT